MKHSLLLKFPVVLIEFLLPLAASSQECSVESKMLAGNYTGDCKKGKAHGKGKAVGTDTYEGEFRSGLPDGEGTYTWSNGNAFTGKYSKGLRDGKGIMTFKKENGLDSVVEGFWKKDVYIGKYEKPWIVHSKTGSIRNVDVEFIPNDIRRVKIVITNTTGGAPTTSGFTMPRYTVDNIQTIKGYFERTTTLETHLKSTETSLMEVSFPLRIKLNMGREEVDVELHETGSYTINISINQ